jgi:hypothetical protein
MRRTTIPVIAVALLALTGCHLHDLDPSGETTTEFRTSAAFTGVELQGVGSISIVPGDDYTVTVTTDTNYIDGVTTEVVDGILILNEHYDFNTHDLEVTFLVTVPSIEKVTLTGAGNFTVEGVDTDAFEIAIAGAGDVTVSGSASTAHVRLAGVGSIDTTGLDAAVVDVELLGAGDVSVAATDTLDVTLNGVGDVTYVGDPNVTSTVAGIGSVRAR